MTERTNTPRMIPRARVHLVVTCVGCGWRNAIDIPAENASDKDQAYWRAWRCPSCHELVTVTVEAMPLH